jgi:thiamine biosynthesis lipoprotein
MATCRRGSASAADEPRPQEPAFPRNQTTRPCAGASSDPSIFYRRHRCHGAHRGYRGQGASGEKYLGLAAVDDNHDPIDIDFDVIANGRYHNAHDLVAHCGVVPGYRHRANHSEHDLSNHDHDDFSADHDHDPSRRYFRGYLAMTEIVTPHAPSTRLATRSFRAIGTTATVVIVRPDKADQAEAILRDQLEAIDLACSRFRPDSELEYLHDQAGRAVEVSPLLFDALTAAVAVAEKTQGAVDPTVGNAIAALGYDCDFDEIGVRPTSDLRALGPVVGFRHIHLDPRTRAVRIPRGVRLDLGSTAKALVVDRAAARIADQLDAGVLVSVGGDVAVAGPPPPDGWPIGIAVDSSASGDHVDQVVAIRQGGLASSSTAVRKWTVGPETVHHIIDPATGSCTPAYWTLVSATGASCVDANALTTAAVVWAARAIERLRAFDQAVRLVRHDSEVVTLGGWPGEDA